MLKLVGSTIWPEIEALAVNSHRKLAAIAFVSDDVRIRFGRGDLLILDASDKRIAAGDTSKKVVTDAVARGAAVYSLRNLHAKLLVLDDTVVIGSSNISKSSQRNLHEVGLVTNNAAVVKSARKLLNQLRATAKRIDGQFLRHIRSIPVIRNSHNGALSLGATKPPLLEFLRTRGPLLNDFVVMLYETDTTLTNREIRQRARSNGTRLPPTNKWTWYEDSADQKTIRVHKRFFEANELKGIGVEVASDNDGRITRFLDVDPDTHVFVSALKIRHKLVTNFIDDSRAPFVYKKRELIRALNQSLLARPHAGRELGAKTGWILPAREFADILGLK